MNNKTEIVLVASGKGGAGKSTFITNIASALAAKGNKVCLVDLDLNLGKLDVLLGLEKFVEKDISDILSNKIDTVEILIKSLKSDNLYLLPAGRSVNDVNISSTQLTNIIEDLKKEQFDYILLDCPAGVNSFNPFRIAVKCSQRAIIITTPEKTSLRDADSTISILENHNFHKDNRLHLVINKYTQPKILSSKKNHLSSENIQATLAIPLLGTLTDNKHYIESVNSGEPIIYKNSKVSNEYNAICDKLIHLVNGTEPPKKKKLRLFNK